MHVKSWLLIRTTHGSKTGRCLMPIIIELLQLTMSRDACCLQNVWQSFSVGQLLRAFTFRKLKGPQLPSTATTYAVALKAFVTKARAKAPTAVASLKVSHYRNRAASIFFIENRSKPPALVHICLSVSKATQDDKASRTGSTRSRYSTNLTEELRVRAYSCLRASDDNSRGN